MGLPPQLSAEERNAALEKAKHSRQVRSLVKSKIKSGELTLADVFKLAQSDPIIGKMRVADLLAALSGVGKIRASSIMERFNISPTRRIQGLGKHQISSLIAEFVPGNKRGKLIVTSSRTQSLMKRYQEIISWSGRILLALDMELLVNLLKRFYLLEQMFYWRLKSKELSKLKPMLLKQFWFFSNLHHGKNWFLD